MGDPKKQRKKYQTPSHPWQKARIEDERVLVAEYGFKNKTEVWKMLSFLRAATKQAKSLVPKKDAQAEREKKLLLSKLQRLGLLPADAVLADILSISLRDLLERRLQTQVYKKKLANSTKQARQFITHQHINVGAKTITSPSYLVSVNEESQVAFREASSLSNPEHPERLAAQQEKKVKKKPIKKDDTRNTNISRK